MQFAVEWSAVYTLSLSCAITSICWNRDGTYLLTGGTILTLWQYRTPPSPAVETASGEVSEGGEGRGQEEEEEEVETREVGCLKEVWQTDMATSVTHLGFSPNGRLFASCGDVSGRTCLSSWSVRAILFSCIQEDCLVKIWYPCYVGVAGIGTPPTHSFCYVAHPKPVRGFVWRRITPSLPR